jgi:formate dehydrogenase subunit gamma
MERSVDVRDLVRGFVERTGGPIVALRALVERFGVITEDHESVVADVFNLSRAEVRGIVSFYSDLVTTSRGRRHVRLCQAEACQAVGAIELARELERHLGVRMGETSADGRVSLEAVYCLGVCASGPAAMVDGEIEVGVTVAGLAL